MTLFVFFFAILPDLLRQPRVFYRQHVTAYLVYSLLIELCAASGWTSELIKPAADLIESIFFLSFIFTDLTAD